MPRRQYVPCYCPLHNGNPIHYKARQRCEIDRSAPSLEDIEDEKSEGAISDDTDDGKTMINRLGYYQIEDEVDSLCLELFANHVDAKTTEETVTDNLKAIRKNIGKFLPPRLQMKIPTTFKQLRALFDPYMTRIIRLAVCPGECRILHDVKPTENFVCWCDGKANVAWR